jgi:hypothetical protein
MPLEETPSKPDFLGQQKNIFQAAHGAYVTMIALAGSFMA